MAKLDKKQQTTEETLFGMLSENTFDPRIDNPELGFRYSPSSNAYGFVNMYPRMAKEPKNIYLTDPFFNLSRKDQKETLFHELEHIRGAKGKRYFQGSITEEDTPETVRKKQREGNLPQASLAVKNFQDVFGYSRPGAIQNVNHMANLIYSDVLTKEKARLVKKELEKLGVNKNFTDSLTKRDEKNNYGKGGLKKYIQEKYDYDPTYIGKGLKDYFDVGNFSEAIADLSAIETINNIDITKDPIVRKIIFNDNPEYIEVYKAVTGLRTDRLDAKDLPPFTAQKPPSKEKSKLIKYIEEIEDILSNPLTKSTTD